MGKISASDVIQKQINDLGLQSGDGVAVETSDKVVLTYDLNRRMSSFTLATSSTVTGTMSITMPSVSAGGKIFLTAISLSLIKDATCDVATGASHFVLSDAQNIFRNIITIPMITLTADAKVVTLSLPYPLEIRPGTAVSNSITFSVGVAVRSMSVVGFTTSSR